MLSERLKKGIQILKEYGFLQAQDKGIIMKAICDSSVKVEKQGKEITITYDTEPHFYMALARSYMLSDGVHIIQPRVKDFGVMMDCSRNAVAKPETVKQLICLLVLFGYNYLELYTEDTYELTDEPYFGYMRGRYSVKELKDIIAFASNFGFEMIPCIQTLAHLNHLCGWDTYSDYVDVNDILLVGDERTYQLIRKCLRFCKEVFGTKRINIGTDEAFLLGRGKYIDRYGYRPKHEVYLEHLRKVFAICKEEGFKPEFWGDAFYHQNRAEGFENMTEIVQSIFDGTQTPIYWEYSSTDAKVYDENIRRLQTYTDHVIYAHASWNCVGFAPYNIHSNRVTDVAFDVAVANGVDHILMTIWGDGGAESSVFAVVPSLCYAAYNIFPCEVPISEFLFALTGYTEEEWLLTDHLNIDMVKEENTANAAKYLVYNDYLIGMMDYHIPDYAGKVYQDLFKGFDVLAKRDSQFSYLFYCAAELCRVLGQKATFGKRLYSAYQRKENTAIKELSVELHEIKQNMMRFHTALRERWFLENKSFGFEVLDVRIGGLIVRTDTVNKLLEDYLEGRIDKIYELEEKRIALWKGDLTENQLYAPYHNDWKAIYTSNDI